MKKNNEEKRLDYLMSVIADELISSRQKYAKQVLGSSSSISTSEKSVVPSNDETLVSTGPSNLRYCRQTQRSSLKKVMVIAATLIIIMGMVITASATVRKAIYNAIFEHHEDHDVIVFGPDDEAAQVYSGFEVNYVPDGYKLILRKNNELGEEIASLYEEYINEDSTLYIDIAPREHLRIHVDNEHTTRELIEFDGIEAYLFTTIDARFLLWSDGRYEYLIYGDLDLEEYIEISRGIKGFV